MDTEPGPCGIDSLLKKLLKDYLLRLIIFRPDLGDPVWAMMEKKD